MNPYTSSLQRILCIGGGPAGLYFALLMKQRDPTLTVTVVERNRPFDTFGWGVVLSDQTLGNLRRADPESAALIGEAFNHWDDIEVFYKGGRVRSGGHGFCGIGRKKLLNILQDRCLALGVNLVFETDVADDQALAAQYNADLVIASDGLNSRIRTRYAETFQPDIDNRECRFVWLGTKKTFDAFTFAFVQTEHGWFQAHAYKFDGETSTFIVETPEAVWKAHGIDQMSQADGVAFCEKLFAPYLDGHPLISNAAHLRGSAIWIRFPRVICNTWVHQQDIAGRKTPIVLMGDAAHTAHFSIGSGTKLALEDAIDLADEFARHANADVAEVLQGYEARRSVEVLKIQNAARNSTEWFENVDRYTGMEVEQFAYSLLTRSQRHQPRKPATARCEVAGRLRELARTTGGAGYPSQKAPHTTDAAAAYRARRHAQEPHRRLAHGAVQRGRWRGGGRLPPRAPGCARTGRCRPGDGGDDQPHARRPHHPRLPGAVERCAAGWLEAHRRFRARPEQRQDRPAAGPQRCQRLHATRLGKNRRATARRQLAPDLRQRRALWRAEPGAARHDPRRHGRAHRRLCRRHAARRRRRL